MTQEELRTLFVKYLLHPTIVENKELLEMYANFFVTVIKKHHNEGINDRMMAEGQLVMHMMLSKVLHLRTLLNGVAFENFDGIQLNQIIDPTVLAVTIRNIYETVSMFNLVYRNPKSSDERTILYSLWVSAGLSYRQRFESNVSTEENKFKLEEEKKRIESLKSTVESTALYQSLTSKNQTKILGRLKDKEYLIKIEGGNVIFLSWREMAEVMGVEPGLYQNLYTYFSLYSHPSNVSVFQFGEMFEKQQEGAIGLTNFNSMYAIQLLSIFTADYIYTFPGVITSFEDLPLFEQIAINNANKFLRGDAYNINTAFEALN